MPGAREDSKRNAGSLRNGVTDGREPPYGGWESKPGPLKEQSVNLPASELKLLKKLGMVLSSWNPIVGKLDQADPGAG